MKTTFLALALVAAFPAFAADLASVPTTGAPAQGEFASNLHDITAQLGLSEEQKAKITPIEQQEVVERRALKQEAKVVRRRKGAVGS